MKSKAFTKVLSVVILFVVVVSIFAGCGHAKYEMGFSPTHSVKEVRIGVKYNNNKFAKDDVTFDLCYGFYDIKWKEDTTRKSSLFGYGDEIFFVFYIMESGFELNTLWRVYDYRNIEKLYFIKEFSNEEAQSDEYAFSVGKFRIRYNHQEKFTVPQDIFDGEYGHFDLMMCSFIKNPEQETEYNYVGGDYITFHYYFIDDNVLQLRI